jgi:hypothetical protein
MFCSEKEMSSKFEKFLRSEFGNSYRKEQKGLFGIPDFIFYAKDQDNFSVISFELKLKDWKTAAKQAFRYRSFSHISYVVLPNSNAKAAREKIEFFKQYNIGLAFFDNSLRFEIVYKPDFTEPYSNSLKEKFVDSIASCRKKTKCIQALV